MPYLPDILNDIADTYAWQQRKASIDSQADGFDEASVGRLTQFAKLAPWVKPGVALSMSRAGVGPGDPGFRPINKLALHLWGQNGAGQYGTPTTGAQMNPGHANITAREAFSSYEARSEASNSVKAEYYQEGFHTPAQLSLPSGLKSLISKFGKDVLDENGFLVDPGNIHTTAGRRFNGIRNTFKRAGIDMPYLTSDGRAVVQRYNPDSLSQGGLARPGVTAGTLEDVGPQPPTPEPSDHGGFGSVAAAQIQSHNPFHFRGSAKDADALKQAGIPFDPNDPFAPLATISNPGSIVLNAPVQEVQGQVRNIYAATHGKPVDWLESQSDLGVAISAIRDGRTDTNFSGNGFFIDPDSQVARERRDREAKRGQIGGHNITLGRWLADTVTEPDTTPFNILSGVVDAGVQVADPTVLALNKAGDIRLARDLFAPESEVEEAAGLIRGIRRSIHRPTFSQWKVGEDGIRSMEALTNEQSPAKIWRAMGRRVDPAVAARLADTRTTAETEAVLEDLVGPIIRKPSELTSTTSNLGSRLNPRQSRSRLFEMMPGDQLDTLDRRQVATQLERSMVNAKVPQQHQDEVLNLVARSDSRGGIVAAANHAMAGEQGVLVQHGIAEEHANRLVALANASYDASLDGLSKEVGTDTPIWTKMTAGGKEVEVPGPHLSLEHGSRYIPLPDSRAIKRLLQDPKYRWLTTSMGADTFGQANLPVAAMDFVTQQMWKPLTLLGRFPAWVTRVVGESQIRMAVAGNDSLFRHPVDFLSWVVHGRTDPLDVSLSSLDEYASSVVQTHGGWLERPGVVISEEPKLFQRARPDQLPDFRKAWGDQLAKYSADPIVNNILNNGIDDTETWLRTHPDGQKVLQGLIRDHPRDLLTHEQLQTYLHTLSSDVTHLTGGDTQLIEAMKTGQYKHLPIHVDGIHTNRKFVDQLAFHIDSSPKVVKGSTSTVTHQGRLNFPDRWNRAVDWAFAHTMSLADNLWDRSPTFKQYLWQHTRELLPYADKESQQLIIENARKAKIPNRVIKSLERASKTSADRLGAEELTHLARGYAADSSKKLLYDLAEKAQIVDGVRVLAPFANAYAEIFGSWSKLLNEIGGPGAKGKLIGGLKVYRRASQIMAGARGEDFGQVVGAPTGEGFFFKDPYGQESFVIPGSQFLTQSLTGVPVPLTGNVQNLNMVGSVLPGLGPVAAVPAAWMMQDKPQFDGVRDLILPYGAPGEREPADMTNILTYAPGWMRKYFDAKTNGGYDQRTWFNAQKDVMAYLYSTGDYDTTTRAGMQKLLSDAKDKSESLYKIRAATQFFSPTAPSFRFLIQDKSGSLLATSVLVQDYYRMQQDNYDTASQSFLETYGPNAILATIPKSGATIYGLPRNREQENFILTHPKLRQNHPLTWGMFLPQSDDFDYEVYINGFTSGDRDQLTPEQWLYLSNATRRDAMYRQYVDQLGGRTDQGATDYLREVRHALDDQFPVGITGLPAKPNTPDMIRELYEASKDPLVLSTDAGQGLKMYLTYRDQAQQAALDAGYVGDSAFSRADSMMPVRQWLNEVASGIADQHPDFQQVWDVILSRETQVDTQEGAQ